MVSREFHELLSELRAKAEEAKEKMSTDGTWVPIKTPWEFREARDFQYSREKQGPQGWTTKTFEGDDWLPVALKLGETLEESGIYKRVEDAIKANASADFPAEMVMERFTWQFQRSFVPPEPGQRFRSSDSVLAQLAQDLDGAPIDCESEVQVLGLVILAKPFSLPIPGGEIRVRPLLQEDFERPTRRTLERYRFPDHRTGTAILDIQVRTLQSNDLQKVVHKSCMLFSLFDAANVQYSQYTLNSRSFRDFMGGGSIHSGPSPSSNRPLVLEDSDIEGLRTFWSTFWDAFPIDPFAKRNEGPATVAYSRYTEACTEVRSPEYNMATVMMGLEGLLADGEPEIAYRMSMRLARICSLAAMNPQAVYDTVRDGYRIRSVLVHGGSLDHRDTRKFERLHGSMENLLKTNLRYLRFMIALWFVARLDKSKFLDLVDEAMWDAKKAAELERLVHEQTQNLGRLKTHS